MFPTTGAQPVKGEYALARFTSGGDLLAGWAVQCWQWHVCPEVPAENNRSEREVRPPDAPHPLPDYN